MSDAISRQNQIFEVLDIHVLVYIEIYPHVIFKRETKWITYENEAFVWFGRTLNAAHELGHEI